MVRLGVAVVAAAATLRYIYGWLTKTEERQAIGNAKKAASAAGAAAASNIDSGEKPEEGVWIYFGSQSGTAEGFSKEIEQECEGHQIKATVVDMEDLDKEMFPQHKVVILMMATYGEGDPTDNAVDFFNWIKDESLPVDLLKGVQFTVMGLGNRQYVNFNACGKDADVHMERLGAQRIYDRGEGDDDQNIEEDFEQWKGNGLWPALKKALGMDDEGGPQQPEGALDTPEAALAKLPLRGEVGDSAAQLTTDPMVQNGGGDVLGKWYFSASHSEVVVCKQLRQKPDEAAGKTTKHLDFDVKDFPALEWRTADNLEVLPCNPDETVEWFAKRLGVSDELDSDIVWARAPGIDKVTKKPFPPCKLRTALSMYCDLCQAPTRSAARRIASFARDPEDREALEKLLQDRESYQWLTGDGVRLSFREFFELYLPSAEISVGAFLQICPRQKSRPYTISSSYREDRHRIGVCVSVVKEDLQNLSSILKGLSDRGHAVPHAEARIGSEVSQRSFWGSCSTMLCQHTKVGDKLWVYARASSFRLPRARNAPIIMVGAGTGMAPFRAFVREFKAEGGVRPKTILFFGCTKEKEDFIYRDELEEAMKTTPPALTELVTAFSRDQDYKVYVQHRLKERASEVKDMLENKGHIYVCGAVAMGASVREELVAALGSNDYVNRLQTEGRYVEELW